MGLGKRLERSEIEDKEIERYPDQRVTAIPSDYLEKVNNYAQDSEDSEALRKALNFEIDRRKRDDLRLNEVPSTEDLFKIKKYANDRMLNERKCRRRITEERIESLDPLRETDGKKLKSHTCDEMGIRRSHQFMEYLDTEFCYEGLKTKMPSQEKVEGDIGLYMRITDTTVEGIKYKKDGMMAPDAAWLLDRLAAKAAGIQRKLEEKPERIGNFGDTTFYSLTEFHADFLEGLGNDIDRSEMLGDEIYDLDELMNHVKDESNEALETLETIGVTYFEIEGIHIEEVASLVDHLKVGDRFKIERIPSPKDTDMNSKEWREHHVERIRKDTDENNHLWLFLDDEGK